MGKEMKHLDKEIENYLKFNMDDLSNQMNNAFEGKKQDWRDKYLEDKVKTNHEYQKQKTELILGKNNKVPMKKTDTNLEPILEENNALVPYVESNETAEARKKKNEKLKMQVRMIAEEKMETSSQISSTSSANNFFVTGVKPKDKTTNPDSSTELAAMALSLINKKDDKDLQLELRDQMHDLKSITRGKNIGEIAMFEIEQTETDMKNMFKELDDLQNQIKGNIDLKEMENLMKSTNEVMDFHKKSFNNIRESVTTINKQADDALKSCDFYSEELI